MEVFEKIGWIHLAYALGLITVGYFIAKRVSKLVSIAIGKRFSRHHAVVAQRVLFYGLFLIFIVSAFQQLGFKMTVVIGAAGVFTVAMGFAAQTAASNLVSGLFLLFERPFKVGDVIKIDQITGSVEGVDLLSIKLRTPDNMLIRMPNESIMKSNIMNMSYFKTRRVDIRICAAYNSNLGQVRALLMALASQNCLVLKDPAAKVIVQQFGENSIELMFMAWTLTEHAGTVKAQLMEAIKARFEEEHIDMSSPQITLLQNSTPAPRVGPAVDCIY